MGLVIASISPEETYEDGLRRLDPLVLGSISLVGLKEDEVMASDRRLRKTGTFEVPPGVMVALFVPTRAGMARLVSLGRVLITVSSAEWARASQEPEDLEEVRRINSEIKDFLGREVITPLDRVKDGYLIVAENVLKSGVIFPGMGEWPDEGFVLTESWLELSNLKGGFAGFWGRTWGRLYAMSAKEALTLLVGSMASSPTLEGLLNIERVENFTELIDLEIRRLRYLGWHRLYRGVI